MSGVGAWKFFLKLVSGLAGGGRLFFSVSTRPLIFKAFYLFQIFHIFQIFLSDN